MKATVTKYRKRFADLDTCKRVYDARAKRSRTSVGGVKAVRLDGHSMYNTTLRTDGNNGYIFRLYDTDIVHYSTDGYITLNHGGYPSVTTFARIQQASGIMVVALAPSTCITTSRIRIQVEDSGATSTRWDAKKSVPFFDGMRVHAVTHDIHPEDVSNIPSDRRKKYRVPSAKASKEFKSMWANVAGILKLQIGLGVWAEDQKKDGVYRFSQTYAGTNGLLVGRLGREVAADRAIFLLENGATERDLYECFMQSISGKRLGSTDERITAALKRSVPGFRKAVLAKYAENTQQWGEKGGDIIKDYYVNPKDVKNGNA